ncbi:MAG: hypothetical protein WD267_11170 [Balneolales bacterium]
MIKHQPLYKLLFCIIVSVILISASLLQEDPDQKGETIWLEVRGSPPLSGELLSMDLQSMFVLLNENSATSLIPDRQQSTVAQIYFDAIDQFQIGVMTYRTRYLRRGIEFHRLSLDSRYPTGITRDTFEVLLEEFGQDEPYEIRW